MIAAVRHSQLTCQSVEAQGDDLPSILIIEDDPMLGSRLKQNLELTGYCVSLAIDGVGGLSAATQGSADLILLDLMLPQIDGLSILGRLRKEFIQTPVIILTAKGMEADRLDGFRAGCDDYVTKPFSMDELTARIKAVLRRSGYRSTPSAVSSGGLTLDPEKMQAVCNGQTIELRRREFDLLYQLVSRPNRPISRYALLDEVWGEEEDASVRTVDAAIAFIRRKLESVESPKGAIETVYKVGYRWKVGEDVNMKP